MYRSKPEVDRFPADIPKEYTDTMHKSEHCRAMHDSSRSFLLQLLVETLSEPSGLFALCTACGDRVTKRQRHVTQMLVS